MMDSWAFETAARTLCQEVRGEPLEGQQAVAYVLKNRLADGRWGTSLASVCLWHAQFSGWWSPRGTPSAHDPNFSYACNLADDDATLSHMRSVLQAAMDGQVDLTNGALFYYSNIIAEPAWAAAMKPRGKFGRQFFFTDK